MLEAAQYQCLDCLALFDSAETWLEHRRSHSRSSTHSHAETMVRLQLRKTTHSITVDCICKLLARDVSSAASRGCEKLVAWCALLQQEYVLQADGTITPLNNTHNYVLSEQQAGEILAQVFWRFSTLLPRKEPRGPHGDTPLLCLCAGALQVLSQQKQQQLQRKFQSPPKAAGLPRSSLLPPVIPTPGSATMHLQILTAQALADNSGTSAQHRARLNSILPSVGQGSKAHLGVLENGVQKLELRLVPSVQDASQQQLQQPTDLVVIHPYECSECSLLFQTPEDYLQHQGEHFLGQDKESGESGVMSGFEEARGRNETADGTESIRVKVAEKKVAFCAKSHQCELCHRTFTSINRLAAHTRVHEQGTYECPDCGKMFKKATSLQTHMRTHSGVARYLCVDCGSGFTTEMTLIMHR